MAAIVIIALVTFAAGAVAAAVVLVSWGIKREERDFTLTRHAHGPVATGTRRITGLYVRQLTDAEPSLTSRQDLLV